MTLAPPNLQLDLVEVEPSWKITKNAQARNAYGTVAQHLVCAALKLLPIPINGNYDICFDALGAESTYYEIKSVKGRGGKMVVYDWRMAKESKVKARVIYAVLLHNVKGSDGSHLVSDFIKGGLKIVVIPAWKVHEVAAKQPLNKLKAYSRVGMGYNRKGYIEGYRNVPVQVLKDVCECSYETEARYAGHDFKCMVYLNYQLH